MLGMNDMHKLKNELKAGSKTITKGDTFLDCTDADFYEYIQMKQFLNKPINSNLYLEFDEFIRCGGFPKSLYYNNIEVQMY